MEPKIRFDKPRRAFYVVVVAAFALIGVGAFFSNRQPAQPVATAIQQTPRADLPQTVEKMPPATPAPVQAAAPTTPAETVASKSKDFDRLVATHKPEDAYAAYRILYRCAQVTSRDECGDLTGGQKTMAYPLLKQAVAGHVADASVYLYITTPDGTPPNQAWGNPAYAEWEADARREIAAAAARGDAGALQQMAEFAALEKDQSKAVTYWTAYMDRNPTFSKQLSEETTHRYSQGLTPEKIAVAVAEGHAIK